MRKDSIDEIALGSYTEHDKDLTDENYRKEEYICDCGNPDCDESCDLADTNNFDLDWDEDWDNSDEENEAYYCSLLYGVDNNQ